MKILLTVFMALTLVSAQAFASYKLGTNWNPTAHIGTVARVKPAIPSGGVKSGDFIPKIKMPGAIPSAPKIGSKYLFATFLTLAVLGGIFGMIALPVFWGCNVIFNAVKGKPGFRIYGFEGIGKIKAPSMIRAGVPRISTRIKALGKAGLSRGFGGGRPFSLNNVSFGNIRIGR